MPVIESDERRAMRLQDATTDVLKALEAHGLGDDPPGAMKALGVAAGCFARASESPTVAMESLRRSADGIISGELLSEAPAEP